MQEPSFPIAPSSVNHSLSFLLPLTRYAPRARIQKLVILRGSEHLRSWVPADQSLKRVQDTDEFLLFDPETHKLLGVRALGQRATEIIHIGQAVLFYGEPAEYFRDMVFNYPTLAEAHNVAALDGLK
jgi:hypothetical protein